MQGRTKNLGGEEGGQVSGRDSRAVAGTAGQGQGQQCRGREPGKGEIGSQHQAYGKSEACSSCSVPRPRNPLR